MDDIDIKDVTDPEEIADEIDQFARTYARRTGDYTTAGTMMAAASWLRHFVELQELDK